MSISTSLAVKQTLDLEINFNRSRGYTNGAKSLEYVKEYIEHLEAHIESLKDGLYLADNQCLELGERISELETA